MDTVFDGAESVGDQNRSEEISKFDSGEEEDGG